jgi:hypothetical protein
MTETIKKELIPRKKWVTGLYSCCTYIEPDTKQSLCCPYFFPMSLLGNCCIEGRMTTILNDESVICCEMGSKGFGACMCGIIPSLFGPLGGLVWFAASSVMYRNDIAKRYGVTDDEFCCSPCSICDTLCLGLHYPCSFFQMYVSLRQWDKEDKKNKSSTTQ